MFTQCPKCGSYFRVRDEELHAAGGEVRCSLCTNTFNALSHLENELPQASDDHAPEPDKAPSAPTVAADEVAAAAPAEPEAVSASERDPLTRDLFDGSPEHGPDPTEASATAVPSAGESVPEEVAKDTALSPFEAPEQRPAPSRGESALWMLGSIALLLTLAVQLIHAERHYWTQHEWLGAPVSLAYEQLTGQVPQDRDLTQLEVIRADIAGTEQDSSNLRVTGVVENQGDRDQPLPAVYVRLEDRWGLNMGHGFFDPQDWIYREQLPAYFPARTRLPLRLELSDPGQDAVGFHVELCWPEDDGYACRPQRGGAAFTR